MMSKCWVQLRKHAQTSCLSQKPQYQGSRVESTRVASQVPEYSLFPACQNIPPEINAPLKPFRKILQP